MGTAPRKGFNLSRSVGSGTNSAGLTEYDVASSYGTALGAGDPMKIHTDGTLIKATNGADAIGIFEQVKYTNAQGEIKIDNYLPASTVSSDIKVLISDNPTNTYSVLADGTLAQAKVGDIYAMNLSAADANTGRSTDTVNNIPIITGDVDMSGYTTPVGDGVSTNLDAFTLETTDPDNAAVTVEILTATTMTQLLAAMNAITGISAELDGTTGFLEISTTDGYLINMVDTVGTFITDYFVTASPFTAAGTKVVAANAGLVKVIKITDAANKQLEVVTVNHSLRDDG